MADENDKPTLDPQPRRRAPPPTIDLEATDVSPTDSAPNAAPDSAPDTDASSGSAASDAPSASEPRPRETKPPRPARTRSRGSVLAGAVGAALALAVAGGAWYWLGGTPDGTAEMNARLARAEAQLAARPAQPADPKELDDLARRVGALESAPAAAPAASAAPPPDTAALADLARRLDAVAASARAAQEHADAAKSLAEKAAADAARPAAPSDAAPSADRADLDALAARVGKLESADQALADRLAKAQTDLDAKIVAQSVAATAAAAARDAIAALALALAVERGAPYAHELAALDPADPQARAALAPFATTGVPSAFALARELAALVPAARAAAAPPASDASLLDRLGVRVRPIGTPPGDAPPEVLARLETAAGQGDLAAARADAAKLPDAARAALDPWSRRVAAREAALGAASALVAGALDALHAPPGAPTR